MDRTRSRAGVGQEQGRSKARAGQKHEQGRSIAEQSKAEQGRNWAGTGEELGMCRIGA